MKTNVSMRTLIISTLAILFTGGAQASDQYFRYAATTNMWNTSSNFWGTVSGGPYSSVWVDSSDAIFEGAGGSVTVSGTQQANSLLFNVNGFTLTTGTLTIGNLVTPGVYVTNGATATISATLNNSGTGNAIHIGKAGYSGTLTLNGNFGALTGNNRALAIDNGNLYLSTVSTSLGGGTGGISIGSGTTLTYDISSGVNWGTTAATTLTGSGSFVKKGTGTLVLGSGGQNVNINLGTGAHIDLQAGSIETSSGYKGLWVNNYADLSVATGAIFKLKENQVPIGALNGAGMVSQDYSCTAPSLTLGRGDRSGSFSGVIKDNGNVASVTKTGSGTQTLSGVNTYSGATMINAGKLVGVVGGSCSNSAVSVAATSGNSASLGVSITDNTKQWTCSSLTVNNAGTGVNLDFNFGNVAPSLTLAPLKVTGTVTFTTLPNITVLGFNIGGATNTVYPLMAWSGSSVSAPSVTVTGSRSITAHTTVTGTSPNFTLNLVIDTNLEPLTWAVGGSGFWDTSSSNWQDAGGATVTYSEVTPPGDQVVFSDAGLSADATVTLNSTLNPANVTVNNSTYNYTFSGSGAVAGSASLIKSGTKTLTLLTNNTYTGGTTINGGTLQVGNGGTIGSLGSGPVVDNGTISYNLGSATTLSLPSGTAISGSGNISVSAGLMQVNGNIILGGSHSYTQNGAWSSGVYTKGMEVTADATLRGSAISLIAEIGKRDGNGNNLTLDTSSANGPINLNVSFGRGSLWYGLNSFTANAGTGPITIFGANANNSQSMPGSYSLSGGLTISNNLSIMLAPTINLRATAASIVSGNVTLGWTANNFNVDTGVTMVVSGVLSGTAAPLMKQGAGTLVLSAKNTYPGGTTVSNGTLSLLGSLTNSSVSTIGTGAFIEALTGSVAGNGVSFTQGSTGSSIFRGVNTYTGGTTVSNGTLTVSSVSSLGSNSVATVRGGTLAFEAGMGGRVISNDLVLTGGAVLGGYRPAASGSGGIITSDGIHVRHTFTNVGNTTLTFSATVTNVSGVVVGGGGGAGGQQSGVSWLAGGAGGQVTSFTNVFLAAGSTTITVGSGGAYNVLNTQKGSSGGNSSIGTYTSGGMYSATGGFGGGSSNGTYVAGQGGTSPGNIINGVLQAGSPFAGGLKNGVASGGGAGAGGVGASGITGGNGGIGVTVDRIGLFGGGGNGAAGTGYYGIGATAYGGGTQGNGLASTGGGGGALGGNAAGGNGGSGIVIIQYPYTDYAAGTLTLAGSISVQSNSTLNVYTGGAIVISGAMTNTANLTQIGSGSLLINGTVTGGVITVSSGVFGGTGVVSGTVTNWAALTAGATNTLGTLTVKNLVMAENSTVTWNYDSTTSDVIQVSGTLTLPTVATVNVSRVSGTWPANPSVLFNVTGSVQGTPSLANWVVTGDCRPGTRVFLQDNQVLIGFPRGTCVRFF